MGNKVRYYVLFAAIIMMIGQFFISDYNHFFGWKNLLPFISLICIIIAMYGSIIHVSKHGEN
ncbi:hypothetical protein MC378_01135 [Polaribacter sp. MSW13]|uniref:Uncharacterized protein n=1 Tax=Polaribacter marinus TaxID=2916838 RepID=A0A9X1VKL7_9FLAO|nr:hypothetical protein [Polaribacter marinus]MCI2227750.1 hypothetical protein [Polaribacter marinus]